MNHHVATDLPLDLQYFERDGLPRHGLPGSAYTSDAFWARETSTLFPRGWTFVGFAHELDRPGDVRPVAVGGRPVLLVRGEDGALKAFHNVCRHRCLKLVDKPGNRGRLLKCPYHAWAYDLNGRLRSTPYFGGSEHHEQEGFDRSEHGLVPIRTGVWHDWIFVNLSGDAEAFDDFVAPLARHLDGVDFSKLQVVGVIDLGVIETNWKFLMENFIEPYHVQFVHATTTDQPLTDHYTVVDGRCLGSAIDVADDHHKKDESANTLAVSSRYLTLFPNFVFGRYFPDQLGVHENTPIGPGQTRQRRAIYTTNDQPLGNDDADALMALWRDVHREDHEICERLQEGRKSDIADGGGVLSPHWENSVRRFQEFVVEAVS